MKFIDYIIPQNLQNVNRTEKENEMFAHFADRRNFTIEDNFTYVVNFTRPYGQT